MDIPTLMDRPATLSPNSEHPSTVAGFPRPADDGSLARAELGPTEAFLATVRPFLRPQTTNTKAPERRLSCRTAFISDTHLGFDSARPEDLVKTLRRLDCQKLYLVGDIIDMWQLRRRWRWNDACDEAIGLILDMARRGVEVIYIPGNHDEAARPYTGIEVGGVGISLLDIHETADGRRVLVTHGDQYDLVVKHSRLLCMLGNVAYDWLIRLNRAYNRARRLFGKPYWSLSHFIKLKVKSACTYISRFEDTLVHEAERQGLDGVVCGHIHKAEIRRRGESNDPASVATTASKIGIDYFNCGDWVESCTLLTEDFEGRFEIVDGLDLEARFRAEEEAEAAALGVVAAGVGGNEEVAVSARGLDALAAILHQQQQQGGGRAIGQLFDRR